MKPEKGDLYCWKRNGDVFVILGLEEDFFHGKENPTIKVNYLSLRYGKRFWGREDYITSAAEKLG